MSELKIQSGRYYRTRDGRKVGPMCIGRDGEYSGFPWTDKGPNAFGRWSDEGEDGETCMMGETDGDLIAEWQDDQPAHIVTTNGRHYDLTALETPFGLLPEPVRDALLAWPHGVEMMTYSGQMISYANPYPQGKRGAVWRAKPAPVETRVRCYRNAVVVGGVVGEYGTCIKRPDGSIDWTSWEPEA